MGWNAGCKLRLALENLSRVIAIEVVAAARGIELRTPLTPAPATAAAIAALRESVAGPGPDRYLSPELSSAERLVSSGGLIAAVRAVVGDLE
jgi:histidine ammonia-lyase